MNDPPASADYSHDPRARRAEWHRYYGEKRIGHQCLQADLLAELAVETVFEIGPYLGLVSAFLDNAGYRVTRLDRQPSQYPNPRIAHFAADLYALDAGQIRGFDCILCCETLEHVPGSDVDRFLALFQAAGARHLVVSVPYESFQIDARVYVNRFTARTQFVLKKFRHARQFKPSADPHGHQWEIVYRGRSLGAFEAKLVAAGFRQRLSFSSPTRSVFYVLDRLEPAA